MSGTSVAQKQCGINRNKMIDGFSLEHDELRPSTIIKTMLKIIKIKSNDSMNEETRIQFSKIVDAAIQMTEEI